MELETRETRDRQFLSLIQMISMAVALAIPTIIISIAEDAQASNTKAKFVSNLPQMRH